MAGGLDVEHLIYLVKERPAIWDKTVDEYNIKDSALKAWEEIYLILNKYYKEYTPKQKVEFGKSITKKWVNVRDTWVKWMKKDIEWEETRVGPPVKKYFYSKHLEFLKKVKKFGSNNEDKNETDKDTSVQKEAESDNSTDLLGSSRIIDKEQQASQEEQTEADEIQRRLLKALETKETSCPNMSFFKGILPMVNSLNQEQTLNFQIGVLAILKNLQNSGTNCNPPSSLSTPVRFNQPHQVQPNAQFPIIPSYIFPICHNQNFNQPNISDQETNS